MSLYGMPRIKLAEPTVTQLPDGSGQYEHNVEYSTNKGNAAKFSAVPAMLGNYAASNVSGGSSLLKALLAGGMGAQAGISAIDLTREVGLNGTALGALAQMAAGILASGGGSYLSRRIMDGFKVQQDRNR